MTVSLVTKGMLGGGDSDADGPVISNVSPTPGTELASRQTPITFTIEDVGVGLSFVLVTVRYATRPGTFVVHDGGEFRYPFDSGTAEREATADGYNYTLLPRGGWPDNIEELRVLAFDLVGNSEESEP